MIWSFIIFQSIVLNQFNFVGTKIILDQNTVCVGRTLFIFVYKHVFELVSLVCWHVHYGQFLVSRKYVVNFPCKGQLVKLVYQVRRLVNIWLMLRKSALHPKIHIPHKTREIWSAIRFDHFIRRSQRDIFENFLGHLHASIKSILTWSKMTIYESKIGVIEGELNHDSSLVAKTHNAHFVASNVILVHLT